LDNVAAWILELARGRGIPWKGNYSSWLEQKRTRLQQEEKAESARQKTLQRELEWIRMAPKARQAKGKARIGNREVNSRAYVARFNFPGTEQQKKVGLLSGGERNRVHLAKMLKEGGNVILLDEPTNDLDVNTLRALEEALENFAGCAVVISHDRWFLDRIATHILAFEGESKAVWFAGNYSDYEADRKRRLGAAADQPHRIKYRQLTRS
jgi:ATPase subunit of ABC transporter with duplicated ATPase domains